MMMSLSPEVDLLEQMGGHFAPHESIYSREVHPLNFGGYDHPLILPIPSTTSNEREISLATQVTSIVQIPLPFLVNLRVHCVSLVTDVIM